MQDTENSTNEESSRIATEQTTSFNDVPRPTDSTATTCTYEGKGKGKATEISFEFPVAEALTARKKALAKFRTENPDYAEYVDGLEMSNPEATKNDEKESKARDAQKSSNETLQDSLAECLERLAKLSEVISRVARRSYAERQDHVKARVASPYCGYGHPDVYQGDTGFGGLNHTGIQTGPASAIRGHIFPDNQYRPTVRVYLNGQPYGTSTGSPMHPGVPQFLGYSPYFGVYPTTSQYKPYRMEEPKVPLAQGSRRRRSAGGQKYFQFDPDPIPIPRYSSASATKPSKAGRREEGFTAAGTASQDAAIHGSKYSFPGNIEVAENKETHAEASRSIGREYQAPSVEDCGQCRD